MPDPFKVTSLRWGIVGPGEIADRFVSSVQRFTGQRIVAVASRKFDRASAFAKKHEIAKVFGSYDELFADTEIDAVYVSTRQHAHKEPVIAAITAGKHVLVEKPIASTREDAHAIFEAAMLANVLVMEALWSLYLPQSYIVRQLIADEALGNIRFVQADLGQDQSKALRMWQPDGGGASHDMGVYPLSFIRSITQASPTTLTAAGSLSELGIDVELNMFLRYQNGATALASCSMLSNTRTAAWVDGRLGSLEVVAPFPVPTTLNLLTPDFNPKVVASWTDPSEIQGHDGLCYQATAFADFVERGLTDSPIRSLDDAVKDIKLLTDARHQIGAYYPGENISV
jgi:predicted dehydrogenase